MTQACLARSGHQLRQRLYPDELANDLAVVERDHRVGEFLVALVALAGDEQAVARFALSRARLIARRRSVDPLILAGSLTPPSCR